MTEKKRSNGNKRQGKSRQIWQEIHGRLDSLSREMEGEMTEEELKDLWFRRSLELSRVPEHEKETSRQLKVVTFRLGTDRYGVGIDIVREIHRAGSITPVPTAPEFVVGVTNLRGNILSVVDIRVFFNLPRVTMSERTRILVVDGEGIRIGILVNQVDEIINVKIDDIKPPLSLTKGIAEDYVWGIVTYRGEMLIMVELEKILRNPRLIVEDSV